MIIWSTPVVGEPYTADEPDDITTWLAARNFGSGENDVGLGAPVALWRAISAPADWTDDDVVANEGTGGSSYALTPALAAPTLALTNMTGSGGTAPGDDNRAAVELVDGPRRFSIGLGLGTTDNVGADYGFFCDPAGGFDLSGSFSFAIDFTPNAIGTTFHYFARQNSSFGFDGFFIEEAAASGGFILFVGDQASFTFTPPFTIGGAGVNTETMVAGRQQFVFVVDRDTDLLRCYRNGVALTAEISDISSMGDATGPLPLVFGADFVLHGAAFWTRALSAVEVSGISGGLAQR